MTIEVAVLISIVSVAFSIFFGLKNSKKSDTEEIERKATLQAKTDAKLDEISRNVTDIKYDISATRKDVQNLSVDVAGLQSSYSSLHKRVDRVERTLDLKREELVDE